VSDWRNQDLIQEVMRQTGVPRKYVERVLRSTFNVITNQIQLGSTINWWGFGKWYTQRRPGYTGTNPQNGERVAVPEQTVPRFKWSKRIRQYVK
jgi:nucleoid DNA-binding protein